LTIWKKTETANELLARDWTRRLITTKDRMQRLNKKYNELLPETETEARKPTVSPVKQRNPKYPKPDGVEQSVWDDFVSHRKRKRGAKANTRKYHTNRAIFD
jgi:hypothetical protein